MNVSVELTINLDHNIFLIVQGTTAHKEYWRFRPYYWIYDDLYDWNNEMEKPSTLKWLIITFVKKKMTSKAQHIP